MAVELVARKVNLIGLSHQVIVLAVDDLVGDWVKRSIGDCSNCNSCCSVQFPIELRVVRAGISWWASLDLMIRH